jgi:hypothetical protein
MLYFVSHAQHTNNTMIFIGFSEVNLIVSFVIIIEGLRQSLAGHFKLR